MGFTDARRKGPAMADRLAERGSGRNRGPAQDGPDRAPPTGRRPAACHPRAPRRSWAQARPRAQRPATGRGRPVRYVGAGRLSQAGSAGRDQPAGISQAGSARPGPGGPGSARRDQPAGISQAGSARPGSARPGSARPGSARPGSARPGSARPGPGGPAQASGVGRTGSAGLAQAGRAQAATRGGLPVLPRRVSTGGTSWKWPTACPLAIWASVRAACAP
jgi:hypothetical protein